VLRHICNQWTLHCAAALFAAVLAQCQPAVASPEQGRALAQVLCARCHAIERRAASPHPRAPPFAEVARRYPPEHLAEALAEGIIVGHSDMPVFQLSPQEIEGFLDYLEEVGRD
jgi:mono/diheme cytochrome c family protein